MGDLQQAEYQRGGAWTRGQFAHLEAAGAQGLLEMMRRRDETRGICGDALEARQRLEFADDGGFMARR